MGYAIIKLGGKQYVVREGEKLLVDRLTVDENKTFQPEVIFEGGDGKAELARRTVTAKVLAHVKGDKIRSASTAAAPATGATRGSAAA